MDYLELRVGEGPMSGARGGGPGKLSRGKWCVSQALKKLRELLAEVETGAGWDHGAKRAKPSDGEEPARRGGRAGWARRGRGCWRGAP